MVYKHYLKYIIFLHLLNCVTILRLITFLSDSLRS